MGPPFIMNRLEAFEYIINDLDNKNLIIWGIAHNARLKHSNKDELIVALSNNSVANSLTNGNRGNLTKLLKRIFDPIYYKKGRQEKWSNFLLRIYNLKYCGSCEEVLQHTYFRKNKSSTDGLNAHCKVCHYTATKNTQAGRESNRRATKLNALPKWADLEKIKLIYKLRPDGYHVDHIIPLQGKKVCGLHVEYNLQYLLAKENMSKGNKFTLE